MNSWALSKQFLQCSGQPHRPERKRISLKDTLNIMGLPSKKQLVAGGKATFILTIARRPCRHSSGQSKQEDHTTEFTACDVQMEGTDGMKRWANHYVIPTARSFSGMASRSTLMSGNGQKTVFVIRASGSAQRRKSQP